MSATATIADPPWVRRELRALAAIAAPITAANLSQMAMAVTDTLMLGGIDDASLAAGGLGGNLFFTCVFTAGAVLSGVTVIAARGKGAGIADAPGGAYGSGFVVAMILALLLFAGASFMGTLLLAVGVPAPLAADVATYVSVLRWSAPAAIVGLGTMRAVLPVIGLQALLLWTALPAIALNAALNWQLIHGGFGLPGFGLRGSAAATTFTLWFMALTMLALVHGRPGWRARLRPIRVRGRVVAEIARIGLPAGGTVLMEAGLFSAVGLLAGMLGTAALAANTIAVSVGTVIFMVPYAIGQAGNVRVGVESGAGRAAGARRAGLLAMALGAAVMGCCALMLVAAPLAIVALYLSGDSNPAVLPLTAAVLRVYAVSLVADGIQVVGNGILRGLKDTRVPMVIAAAAYWGIGFPLGWWLAVPCGLGLPGFWAGIAAALAAAAGGLALRFLSLTGGRARPGGSALARASTSC